MLAQRRMVGKYYSKLLSSPQIEVYDFTVFCQYGSSQMEKINLNKSQNFEIKKIGTGLLFVISYHSELKNLK